jgi:hypothetical protein
MIVRIFRISPATNEQFSSPLICSRMMASASIMLTLNALIRLRISLIRLSMADLLVRRAPYEQIMNMESIADYHAMARAPPL